MGCHSEGMKLIDDEVRPWLFGKGGSLFDDLDLYPVGVVPSSPRSRPSP